MDLIRRVFVALAILAAGPAIAAELPVPVATIYPGQLIEPDLIVQKKFPDSFTSRFAVVEEPANLIGKVAKRTLLPGQPILALTIAEQDLVTRGKPVQIVFQHGALTIVAQGTTLQSGGAGDLVRVRNVDSGIIVTGTVQADGTVRVGTV